MTTTDNTNTSLTTPATARPPALSALTRALVRR